MAIILGGFILVMLQGAWVGRYTQNKNHLVTIHFFPAALRGQEILAAYKAQLVEFKEAIAKAEPQSLKIAAGHSDDIIQGLEKIIALSELPPALISQAQENLTQYRHFANTAFTLYSQMLEDPAQGSLPGTSTDLDRLSQGLVNSLTLLASSLNQVVSDELLSITTLSQHQNNRNLIIFLVVIFISSLLVAYILSHSIIIPLKKTVALAHRMAAGDLSQKLDIKHHDEIGELGHAMNTMATQIEGHYQELKDAVTEKTITLQKANQQLRLEIERREDAQHELLNAMEEAEKANRAKSSFLAMMSHELRTPMNGIIGMSSLTLDTALNSTQQRYLTTIRNSAETLLTTINDILDFSKIEANKLELEAVDFEPRKVMDDISERLAIHAHQAGLDFFTLTDPTLPDLLHGDANRLRQILLNLAGNAVKFTESGEVAMRMEVINRTPKTVTIRFSISDTGIGIPQDRLPQLFEPFIQADISTTRKFGGTGLGLSISKRLVQLMGGEIKAESAEGKGSTFWFTVTLAISDHASQTMSGKQDRPLIYQEGTVPSPRPSFQGQDKRILVADDDNTILVVAQAILESFGCLVHLARTGQEVVERLETTEYDLIFMDVQMPVVDGIEATTIIKGWAASPEADKRAKSHTPIIALTADISAVTSQKFLAAGMADYIGKPLRPDSLANCLQKWLPDRQKKNKQLPATGKFSKERLLQGLGGDLQKFTELTLAARIAIPGYLSDLDTACTNNNCQLAAKICQQVKKMAANLRVASLQHQALHLCLAMESTDMAQTKEHYQKLRALLTELLQSLEG